MKLPCLLLLLATRLPTIDGRISGTNGQDIDEKTLSDTSFDGQISEVYRNGREVLDVMHAELNNGTVAFQKDAIVKKLIRGDNHHRELNSGMMEVAFMNACPSDIYVSLAHETEWGTETKTGDVAIESGKSYTFDGVVGNSFGMYGYTDQHVWQGTPGGSSKNCPSNGRCYKDFTVASVAKYTIYLSCGRATSGSQTTPSLRPTASPTVSPTTVIDTNIETRSRSSRRQAWLRAHNQRRRQVHEAKGKNAKLVKWSNSLARSAQEYADLLATKSGCQIEHGYKGNKYGGENLAMAWGWGCGWSPPTPEDALKGWFEKEKNLGWPRNAHYTQVAWRATTLIGCGQVTKDYNDGQCTIQVCRYVRPGNCNVRSGNYNSAMLADSSPCGPSTAP